MQILADVWRSIHTPSHEREFSTVLKSWADALSFTHLEGNFDAVLSRYRGVPELGGQFPYLSIVIQGGSLDLYYPLTSTHATQATLLSRIDGKFGSAHRLGMLARCSTEVFLRMVSRLTTEGSEQREHLLCLINKPDYLPPNDLISDRNLWRKIEEWANFHLPTLWGKARRIKGHFEIRLKSCARSHGVPDARVQQLCDENIHMFIAHDSAAAAFDAAFHGKAGRVFAALRANGWMPGVVKEITGSDVESLFSRDDRGLKQLFDLVIDLRIHVVASETNFIGIRLMRMVL